MVCVCNAWATLREGRAGRTPFGVEAARAHLLAGSGTAYSPDVVRAFLHLEATGVVGHEPTSLEHAAAGILVAVAGAQSAPDPDQPAGVAPSGTAARHVRRPAALLAALVVVVGAWTALAATLQVNANRERQRTLRLVQRGPAPAPARASAHAHTQR